jgi:hypothetical protein
MKLPRVRLTVRWMIVAAAVVAGFGAAVGLRVASDHEPVYRGRRLGAWLDDRYPTEAGPVLLEDDSVKAVRSIGPAAIPRRIGWLRATDSVPGRWVAFELGRQKIRGLRVPLNAEKRGRAMYAFRAPGLAARPAFPQRSLGVMPDPHGASFPRTIPLQESLPGAGRPEIATPVAVCLPSTRAMTGGNILGREGGWTPSS